MTVVYLIGWMFVLFCYAAHVNNVGKVTDVAADITAACLLAVWPITVPISLWVTLRAKQQP